ncbi:DegV family protein [Ureaplasma urealyticum]|uniref:DegV family protein n=1 Tax=Ureaplasma urealyticum TaxID=2130 RepID=UPI0001793BE8|nr:DegV family protein [Ureaplasma urealyticum]EDY74615.1 putative EDD domain protein, DegV family [Ureaplasma urealyticum serovar 4 str. ATCC 27816]
MKKSFLIMTDSSTTLDREWAKNNDVMILPLSILRSDHTLIVDDGIESKPERIYQDIDNGYSFQTSCTPYGVLIEAIKQKLQEYEKIIFIGISSGFSSQFNNAKNLEKEYENRLFAVDTEDFGYSLEDLVYKIKSMLANNISFDSVIKMIDEHHNYTSSFLACENITGLVRSGRIPKIIGTMLKLSKVTPIIKAEWKNHRAGMALNIRSAPHKILEGISHVFDDQLNDQTIEKVCILQAGLSNERIEELKKAVIDHFHINEEKIVVRSGPPIFLVYVWKGALGIQVMANIPKKHVEKKH